MKKISILISLLIGLSITISALEASQSDNNEDNLHYYWKLAIDYGTIDVEADQKNEEPSLMEQIWSLRGDQLSYFLDFRQAIRITHWDIFTPGTPIPGLYRLVELNSYVEEAVFGKSKADFLNSAELDPNDQQYIIRLQELTEAIMAEEQETYFSKAYMEQRDILIKLVEETNIKILSSDAGSLSDDTGNLDMQPSPFTLESCPEREANATATQWVHDSSWTGNRASGWFWAHQPDEPDDCDMYINFYTGGGDWGKTDYRNYPSNCALGMYPWQAAGLSGSYKFSIFGGAATGWPCYATQAELVSGLDIRQ